MNTNSKKPQKPGQKPPATAKNSADALRQNLLKRKQQERARNAAEKE